MHPQRSACAFGRSSTLNYLTAGKDGTTPIELMLEDGSVIMVWPVLAFAEGDIPWLAKLTNSVGHGAKHACYRCAFNGVWHFDAKTVRCDILQLQQLIYSGCTFAALDTAMVERHAAILVVLWFHEHCDVHVHLFDV